MHQRLRLAVQSRSYARRSPYPRSTTTLSCDHIFLALGPAGTSTPKIFLFLSNGFFTCVVQACCSFLSLSVHHPINIVTSRLREMATSKSSFRLENIYDLRGRIALVTGGGTGIGWMIALGLAANGAKGVSWYIFDFARTVELKHNVVVYISGRRREVLEKAVASFKQEDGAGSIIP